MAQTLQEYENIFALEEQLMNGTAPALNLQVLANGTYGCKGNYCGRTDPQGSLTAPFFSKASMIKAYLSQIATNNPGLDVDCGLSPNVAGVQAGQNAVFYDDTVLRLNFSGYARELTALMYGVMMDVSDSSTTPSVKYISSFSGRTSVSGHYRGLTTFFNNNLGITSMIFSDGFEDDGNSPVFNNVTCTN